MPALLITEVFYHIIRIITLNESESLYSINLFIGIINRLLSNYWLVIFSRISYAIYLTQFAVFFYNVGTRRYTTEFQLSRAVGASL